MAKNEGQAIAKARDKFFRDNPTLFIKGAVGQYLKNRLERTFIAGWNAARKENANVVSRSKKSKRS